MAYGDNGPRPLGKVIVGLLVLAAAYGGSRAIVEGGFSLWRNSPARFESNFEEARRANPTYDKMYGAMETYFPEDYAAFKAQMKERVEEGANADELRQAGFEYMRSFAKSHMNDVARAPSAALREFRDAQNNVVATLSSESTELCAHYGMTGMQPNDNPSARAQAALAEAFAAQMRAAADGKRSPTVRDTREVREDDSIAFVNALLEQGLTEDDVRVFSDPNLIDSAASEQQCRITQAMYRALETLPTEQADRLTAIIVTAS